MIKFLTLFLLLSTKSFARDDQYKVERVKISSTNYLCILEKYVGKEQRRDVELCTQDLAKGSKDDTYVVEFNDKLENLFKDEGNKVLLENFASSMPKNPKGARIFRYEDFEKFLNKIESDPACKGTINTYKARKSELEKKLKDLEETVKSNEQSMIGSCSIYKTATPPANKPSTTK